MTFPQSGVAAHTSQTINTTTAQATTQVLNPSYGTTGTPQTYSGTQNPAYPLLYGAASMQLNNVNSIPAQNGYMGANAQALNSTSANTVNGLAPYGAAQGIAQNQAARPDVYINNTFDFIYQQLISMSNYVYRI